MTEPMDIVWSSVEKIVHWGIGHVTKRVDRAAGLDAPASNPLAAANPLTAPLPAALSGPIPSALTVPSLDAAMSAGGYVGGQTIALPSLALPSALTPPSALPLNPSGNPPTVASYADDVAQGIACINCLRQHLGTMQSAADQLPTPEALARIAAEYHVLLRYDLTAEKIAATPEPHQTVVRQTVQQLQPLGQQLATATPQAIALAWGALDESIRFARSNPRTARDQAEIALRMADVDAYGSYVERVLLAPENRVALRRQYPHYTDAEWEQAANLLRKARHIMDQDPTLSLATLTTASAQLAQVAHMLTPQWSVDQSQAFRQSITQVRKQFAQAMLTAMQQKTSA